MYNTWHDFIFNRFINKYKYCSLFNCLTSICLTDQLTTNLSGEMFNMMLNLMYAMLLNESQLKWILVDR